MHFPGKCREKPDKGIDRIHKDEAPPVVSSRKTRFPRQLFRTREKSENTEKNTKVNKFKASKKNLEQNNSCLYLNFASSEDSQSSRSSSKSRDDLNSVEDTQEEFEEEVCNKYLAKMINLAREFAIFCFVLVAYAAITNDPPKVSKEPPAYPFFPKGSPVQDWYRGEISKVVEKAHMTDMTLVMFYAPWDAESQEARVHFEAAAGYLRDEVQFTAVNCWQPSSECRRQYTKVYRWPVFIAYPSHGRGVQYSGPITAAHLIGFVQNVIRPLKRISNDFQPLDFREAFLVAELNCYPGSFEYGTYYVAALRYLEKDIRRPITFYIKPVKNSMLKLSLYLWHQVRIKEFESPSDWTVDNILNWVMKELDQPTAWVDPTSVKSLTLSQRMGQGPALIMFTPDNPLRKQVDYYDMLQEIAYEYKNCDDWGLNFDISSKRKNNFEKFKHLKQSCRPKTKIENHTKIVSIVHQKIWANVSSMDKNGAKENIEVADCNVPYANTKVIDMCQNYKLEKFGGIHSQVLYEVLCENLKRDYVDTIKTSMLRASDPYSMDHLKKASEKTKCRQFLAAEKLQPSFFEVKHHDRENKRSNIEFQGMACKTNRSLNFVAMDSLLYHHFAEKLGIDLLQQKDRSAVVIIDDKLESHFILRKPITVQNLKKFIQNYTKSQLKRSMNSTVSLVAKHTHFYSIHQDMSTFNDNRIVYVEEIYAGNFLDTVLEKNKAVLVLYYSKQCSYCSGISYMFLTISRKLGLVENLKFTRIDGDLNILPWEYTMERFPTILYFPANKKAETRVYPPDLPVTVTNLLGFLLTNLDPPVRIQAMYCLCVQSQIQEEKTKCLLSVRNETLYLINKTLRQWRSSNSRQKHLILHNLKQLRNLQLLFGHTSSNVEMIQSTFRKFKSQELQDYSVRNQSRRFFKNEL